jgi:phosphoribosylaminoimidazole carboxylase PurE protein
MKNPDVVIFMGSDSDWSVMARAAQVLEEFGVAHEAIVSSAHRTHDRTVRMAKKFTAGGTKVFIAGAGAAAHLAGALAAVTPRPVIGVPLSSRLSAMGGLDAILSIVQMPPGVPVACVGVDNAKNAAVLAARILSASESTATIS